MSEIEEQDYHQHHHHHRHGVAPGEIPVPHGPQPMDDQFEEERIFGHITRPDDSYNADGTYWADLPLVKRLRFVSKIDAEEAKKELKTIGQMAKRDPLSPLAWYTRNAIIPGAGLGLEGYVLFSIGNLEPLFEAVWPQCWKTHEVCSKNWVYSVQYLEIIGIMVGQAVVGVIGDWLGRRWGLIQDAAIMLLGLVMLTAAWGVNLQGWVICYAWSLFIYGLGVGGEYPITATSSLENAVGEGKLSTREDRLHRGRRVTMAFLMQGWGQFINQVVILVLLIVFNSGSGNPPYFKSAAQFTFRLSFALPAIGTLWLVYYRVYKMRHASRKLSEAKHRSHVTGYDMNALRCCVKHFGGRLFATAGAWFCNDVFFYGNKLFQGQFIKIISSNPNSLATSYTWNLVNITVSLAGYYLAALLIDNKMYGRKMMQQVGFFFCFLMFVIPAFGYDYFSSPSGIHAFQAMYFLSSFFNQFGPNSVTFLVAGEVYPTPIRATAHGFSACIGKSGALLAAILYNYLTNRQIFLVVPWFGLAGMLVTFFFLPDTTGLDLKEQERRWSYIISGREDQYHGVAIHPKHLSLWERMRGLAKPYDNKKDWRAKIEDMRTEWETAQEEKLAATAREESDFDPVQAMADDDEFSKDIHSFFMKSSPQLRARTRGTLQEKDSSEASGSR